MILNKPWLFLNRMVVINHQGETIYNQRFHHGINIIRGKNSSGKSTIANLIFYGLGGDFNNWTDAAESSKSIFLELDINDNVLTLRRVISPASRQGMYIFYGDYEKASNHAAEGWSYFPYSRSEKKISFSNLLFELLDFPELRGDVDSNITMHQILRLLYIDQKSLTESFIRTEQFDSPLTRKTVYELLLGTYDDSLYSDRLNLRAEEKEYDSSKKQLEGIKRIFLSSSNEINREVLQNEIAETRTQLEKIQSILSERQKIKVEEGSIEQLLKKEIQNIQEKLFSKKSELKKINEEIRELVLDITDSRFFTSTLQNRITALENSLSTKQSLGELPLTHCPQCLSKLEDNLDESTCSLCKQPLKLEENKSARSRMLQELILQKHESELLLKQKEETVNQKRSHIPRVSAEIVFLQNQLNENLGKIQSTRENTIDDLLVQKGNLESKIEFLIKQMDFVEQYYLLQKEIEELERSIKRLKETISAKERQQSSRLQKAHNTIERYAIELLRNDLGRQSEFKRGKNIEIDIDKNTYALDGKNNFSESSKTYLKNSIRYAVFFASLKLDFFRYPKFILCDNMEDKGMEQVRSQNFQRQIVSLSNSFKVEHQIIFTTSMIDEGLNNSKYCIGPFYDESNKTLRR